MVPAIAMTQSDLTVSAVPGPMRTCIVTGTEGPPERMIRFVVGPEGDVVPDLARRLPGRGLWVTAERATLERAVEKNLFSKAARAAVSNGFCWNGRWPISAGRAGPAGPFRASSRSSR